MKWRNISNKPQADSDTQVLFARFDGGTLQCVSRGWFYTEPNGDGFFAPNNGSGYTHWMPYEEYWSFMQKVERT